MIGYEKSDAIVLKMVEWSETSAIVTFFTRDHGRISAVAKGAHRPKSPFESSLDLLAICRVVYIPKPGDALDILTEAKLVRRFKAGQRSLVHFYCGFYVCELLLELTEEGDSLPELFDLADDTLRRLDDNGEPEQLVLRFELQCLRMLGLLPNFENCTGCTADLSDAPAVNFGLLAGGILCPACSSGQRQIIRVRNETIRRLKKLCEANWDKFSVEVSQTAHRAEARGLMNRYLANLVNHRMRMPSLIEGLLSI